MSAPARRSCASISRRTAGWSMTRRISGATRWPSAVRRSRPRASAPGNRRDRHHQPARDHGAVGTRHRQRRAPGHRLAGPAHRRHLPAAGGRRLEEHVRARTGLVVDAYFSGTKLAWLLDNVPGARHAAENGASGLRHRRQLPALALHRRQGPCDRRHQRLAHHAVRHHGPELGPDLLDALRIPDSVLPRVLDCSGEFGVTDPELLGAPIPILGIAGDQQAATVARPASRRA